MSKRKGEASNNKGMTFYEACVKVLNESSKPLTAKQLSDEIMHQNLVVSHGATPAHTIRGRLYEKMKKGKTNITCKKQDGQTYYFIKKNSSPHDDDDQDKDQSDHAASVELEHDHDQDKPQKHDQTPEKPKPQGQAPESSLAIDALLQLSNICEGGQKDQQQQQPPKGAAPPQEKQEEELEQSRKRTRKPVVRYQGIDASALPAKKRKTHSMRTRSQLPDSMELCDDLAVGSSSLSSSNQQQHLDDEVASISALSSLQDSSPEREEVKSITNGSSPGEVIEHAEVLACCGKAAAKAAQGQVVVALVCNNNHNISSTPNSLSLGGAAAVQNNNLHWLLQFYQASVNFNGLKPDQILDSSYTFR